MSETLVMTDEQIRRYIKQEVELLGYGGQKALAERYKVSPTLINLVIHGYRKPGSKLKEAMGIFGS